MPKKPKHDNAKHAPIIPGEFILGKGDIQAFEGRATIELTVANHGDRPFRLAPIVIFLKLTGHYDLIVNKPLAFASKFLRALL